MNNRNNSVISSKEVMARVEKNLSKRYASEIRFIWYGRIAITIAIVALAVLLVNIVSQGYTAFLKTDIKLNIHFDAKVLGIDTAGDSDFQEQLPQANFNLVFKQAIYKNNPQINKRYEKKLLRKLYSGGGTYQLQQYLVDNPQALNRTLDIWVTADDVVDTYYKSGFDEHSATKLQPLQKNLLQELEDTGKMRLSFNTVFFTAGDSREPEQAGIWGATIGSFLTLAMALLLSFPIGIAAAIYLEEYAPTNRWTSIIEVNINNLAAVPSIIIGILGLAIFINFFGLPRSTPLVGGLVLTLMTLPTIIIASRASIKSVPPSIKQAALSIGASRTQMILHHLLPLAMPGMLTGSIIGMSRALGETAPLLMIGMVAFIVDIPRSLTDSATVLPVQIYLWADSPERAFVEKTSAAIIVLLLFLIVMNITAVILRKRLEKRW